jgi:hypothetical protein
MLRPIRTGGSCRQRVADGLVDGDADPVDPDVAGPAVDPPAVVADLYATIRVDCRDQMQVDRPSDPGRHDVTDVNPVWIHRGHGHELAAADQRHHRSPSGGELDRRPPATRPAIASNTPTAGMVQHQLHLAPPNTRTTMPVRPRRDGHVLNGKQPCADRAGAGLRSATVDLRTSAHDRRYSRSVAGSPAGYP